jgi:hypothetical protein
MSNKRVIRDLKDVPHAFEAGDEECCELVLDTRREDPFVEIYARWREFMLPMSVAERKFVKKLVCGSQEVSKEEVDAWVKATKGTLDKGSK